jgi:hypothetical protein
LTRASLLFSSLSLSCVCVDKTGKKTFDFVHVF